MKKGKIFSINYSKVKGVSKTPIKQALLIEGFGLDKDAHAGGGLRQVSLLSIESIRKQKECAKVKKTGLLLEPGDFAENITTEGVELSALKVGDRLRLGQSAIIEISKIGKDCHRYCAIYYKIGDCIMPREGIFARVLIGAGFAIGDDIEVIDNV
ncbi:MAG: MOSC domain-containing protein [Candidatus Omnitrophota bacterium]